MDQKSPHILNTSANLLGLCFVVFSIIKSSGQSGATMSDEITAFGALLFSLSCLFSFMSIRTGNIHKKEKHERYADNIFFAGLCVLLIIVLLTVFTVIE